MQKRLFLYRCQSLFPFSQSQPIITYHLIVKVMIQA